MDVRAVLIIAPPAGETATENIAGVPFALLDVLGRPVILRMIDRLRKFGITRFHVVSSLDAAARPFVTPLSNREVPWVEARGAQVWRAAENAFSEQAQSGADVVLALRLGAYADLDVDDLVQFHLDRNSRVTVVRTPDGLPLDVAAIASSRRNDAAFLFRHQLREVRLPAENYIFHGYVNRLRESAELRRLALDGFVLRAQISPDAPQVRPGVWVAPTARIHRAARIVAPAFIGRHVKVRAGGVVTRASVLEHHAVVDCGTVVENSSVLPHTYIGAALDVTQAVVGFRRLCTLRRGAETEITDARLVGMSSPHAPLRAMRGALSLATFFPAQIFRGLLAPSQRGVPADMPAAVQATSPALSSAPTLAPSGTSEERQFPASLAVARRYGDQ